VDIAQLVSEFGFPVIAAVGLLYMIYFIWGFITNEIKLKLSQTSTTLIALIQERSRKLAIEEEVQSALNEVEREQENTTLAKFLRNLESRIFSQLSRDLSESLFDSEGGGSGGTFDLEGNVIQFINTGTEIVLSVTDLDGGITEVRIPVGSFGICSTDECGI
jgi:hypothetical protein